MNAAQTPDECAENVRDLLAGTTRAALEKTLQVVSRRGRYCDRARDCGFIAERMASALKTVKPIVGE